MPAIDLSDPQAVITAAFSQLSPKQRRLARFLLDNFYVIAFESANKVAAKAEVSPATVVRFCQSLGYDGYPDLQAAIRARMPTTMTAVERGERDLTADESSPGQLVARVFGAEATTLQRTRAEIDPDQLRAAAEMLAAARKVLVLAGGGVSTGAATYFAHMLRVMGVEATLIVAGGLPLAVELANLREDDMLVTINVWRYVREVLEATRTARKRKAACIAITDSPVSPLAASSDYAFVVAKEGVANTLSMSGIMALLNAFIVMLSFIRPQETLDTIRQVDALYRAGRLLLSD